MANIITLETDHNRVTIETNESCDFLGDTIDNLIIPALKSVGFHEESIASYIDSELLPILEEEEQKGCNCKKEEYQSSYEKFCQSSKGQQEEPEDIYWAFSRDYTGGV